jgi:hypothetical protein
MARAIFRTIIPSLLDPNLFQDAFEKASRAMEQDVKGAFIDATSGWKNPPQWRGYVRLSPDNIYISVGTTNEIFKFVDEGTVAHIIKPVKAKMLHWVDPASGEDVFAKEVHHPGTKAQHISADIREIWMGLMPDYFDKYLLEAIQKSGHALHG